MQHQTLNLAGKQMEFAVSNFGTKEDTVSSQPVKKTFLQVFLIFSDYYLRFFSAKRGNRRRPRISRRRQRHCELYFKAYVENLVSFRDGELMPENWYIAPPRLVN